MKICVAQTRPLKGDIQRNIEDHLKLIELAVSHQADAIFFPELSLTGYEPGLAKALVTGIEDSRLDIFQELSDSHDVTIGVGMPLKNGSGLPFISMFIFQPHQPRQVYSKQFLHADELPWFSSGTQQVFLEKYRIAPAICYELSIPLHSENAVRGGAEIYVASVAKTAEGIARAMETLSGIAAKYAITVCMSNSAGPCDDFESAGRTAVWNKWGELAGQMDTASEGILIFDTQANEAITVRV